MKLDDALFSKFGRSFPAGTLLFREGEGGDQMFVIQEGRVHIIKLVRDTEKILATLGPGEFFGEMAILNSKPRSATAIVAEDAKLLVINGRTFETMVTGNTEIALRMIKKLSQRLDEADRQIENLLLRDHNSRVVHGLAYLAEARGTKEAAGIRLEITVNDLADRVGLEAAEVDSVLSRLVKARFVRVLESGGFLIPEVARLWEFLDFLEMKEKFGDVST